MRRLTENTLLIETWNLLVVVGIVAVMSIFIQLAMLAGPKGYLYIIGTGLAAVKLIQELQSK